MDWAHAPLIAGLVAFIESSKYALLFAGAFVEGPIVMLGGGFAWHLGGADFVPAYLALVLGDFIADLGWYWVGYFGARRLILRWGWLLDVTPQTLAKMERLFHTYHLRILTISKLTMGFGTGTATLLTAGMLRVPFFSYAAINLVMGFVWVYILMHVGYWFGNIYEMVPTPLQVVFGIAVFAGVLLALRQFSRWIATKDF
jgi:membrane protein DedA with SNARE-associated domain